jgi:DNA-binding transcriptional MerR regulator
MIELDDDENTSTEQTPEGFYPIRTVASLTGVNSITLRAWERRYGLLKPHRTPSGHRLYSQQDIDLINRVVELLDKGLAISQAKKRLDQEAKLPGATPTEAMAGADLWASYQQRMINALVRFDEEGLEATYNEALSLYPVDIVTTRLVVPLLRNLGRRWELQEGNVAEEHFFTTYLRNKLGARLHHQSARRRGPKLIAACLPGEFHEVGLLLFCLSAASRDYRIVLLGANMPLRELPLVQERTQADAVVLSASRALTSEHLQEDLAHLVTQIKGAVFVGGGISVQHHDAVVRAGAIPVGDDMHQALRRIDEALADRP